MALEHTVGQLGAQRRTRCATGVAAEWGGCDGFRLRQHIELAASASELHAAAREEVGARCEPALTLAHTPGDDADLAVLERQHGQDAV